MWIKFGLVCSLAEELVMAAQAVEMGKGLQRELAALQDNYEQAGS